MTEIILNGWNKEEYLELFPDALEGRFYIAWDGEYYIGQTLYDSYEQAERAYFEVLNKGYKDAQIISYTEKEDDEGYG